MASSAFPADPKRASDANVIPTVTSGNLARSRQTEFYKSVIAVKRLFSSLPKTSKVSL